jgi:hypothetical protein
VPITRLATAGLARKLLDARVVGPVRQRIERCLDLGYVPN